MNLDVTTTVEADRAVLRVVGAIDIASRDRFGAAAADAVAAGATSLVVDLSGVTFIDSTGIGTLIDAAELAGEAGGTFTVREPSRPVARILEVSGLAEQWQDGSAA